MSALSSTAFHTVFEALSHFDAATHGEVTYREEPYGLPDPERFWSKSGWHHLGAASIEEIDQEYSVAEFFHVLTDDECWKVISFVENHRESFWALDAIRGAVIDQALDNNYKHLVSNVALLWDEATSRVMSLVDHGDCFSYRAIRGLPDIDISVAAPVEAERYRALMHFVLVTYYRSHCTISPSKAPVQELSRLNMIRAQEPYRSVVMSYPRQLETILRWEEITEGKPDEIESLVGILQNESADALAPGIL